MARLSFYLVILILCNSWTLFADDTESAHEADPSVQADQQGDNNTGSLDILRQELELSILKAVPRTPQVLAGLTRLEEIVKNRAEPLTKKSMAEVLVEIPEFNDQQRTAITASFIKFDKDVTAKVPTTKSGNEFKSVVKNLRERVNTDLAQAQKNPNQGAPPPAAPNNGQAQVGANGKNPNGQAKIGVDEGAKGKESDEVAQLREQLKQLEAQTDQLRNGKKGLADDLNRDLLRALGGEGGREGRDGGRREGDRGGDPGGGDPGNSGGAPTGGDSDGGKDDSSLGQNLHDALKDLKSGGDDSKKGNAADVLAQFKDSGNKDNNNNNNGKNGQNNGGNKLDSSDFDSSSKKEASADATPADEAPPKWKSKKRAASKDQQGPPADPQWNIPSRRLTLGKGQVPNVIPQSRGGGAGWGGKGGGGGGGMDGGDGGDGGGGGLAGARMGGRGGGEKGGGMGGPGGSPGSGSDGSYLSGPMEGAYQGNPFMSAGPKPGGYSTAVAYIEGSSGGFGSSPEPQGDGNTTDKEQTLRPGKKPEPTEISMGFPSRPDQNPEVPDGSPMKSVGHLTEVVQRTDIEVPAFKIFEDKVRSNLLHGGGLGKQQQPLPNG